MFVHGDPISAQLAFRLLGGSAVAPALPWCLSEEQRVLDVGTARRWQLAMALPGFRFLLDEAGFVEEQQRLWERL